MTYGTFLAISKCHRLEPEPARPEFRHPTALGIHRIRRTAASGFRPVHGLVELESSPATASLCSRQSPEWHTADFAINGSGGVTVPVYFHESPERITYILKHSGAHVIFVPAPSNWQSF